MQPLLRTAPRALEFGIYRDGDNNLDDSQLTIVEQALATSAKDDSIQFTVEDTTHPDDDDGFGLATSYFTIDGGKEHGLQLQSGADMASEKNLAGFVARTLDNAEKSGASQTWIDLVDHGAGDGGGLEADSFGRQIMTMPDMARAIADGVAMHAKAHPEDAGRKVDGVVANQCLMASLGFADALSHAGVRFLAASPETMVSPGVPSSVAHAIAAHETAPGAMANAIVKDVMNTTYGIGTFGYTPAAAFDVIDTSRPSFEKVENAVTALNDAIANAGRASASALRQDANGVDGMARFPEATPDMPWRADRPAIALYDTLASDERLGAAIRDAAKNSAQAVRSIVLAHSETSGFEPFGGSSYTDAAGPTVHFPTSQAQIDPWAPKISETHNRFFTETHAVAAEGVLA
ncbi:MAG TPA: hypothetical protein VFL13_09025 [Candidatus Baltobacteraceae bacterium]|nr:hypothetical protein [Candidatus Baltobacteraceae bacterium]